MKIIAFDLSGIFWNAAFGGTGKEDVEAPFRITCDVIRNLSDGYDRVVVAVDASTCFRQKVLPTYKSNRPERFDWQYEQLRRVITWAEGQGHHVFRADDYEADDLLMTVAAWGAANNHHVTVVSNDKDMVAVLGAGPDVLLYRKHSKDGKWYSYSAEEVEKVAGFHPRRQSDFLALAGDSADNFKFFDGLAEGYASKIVKAYATLEDVWTAAMNHSDTAPFAVKVPEKVLAALRQDYATVYLKALDIATPRANVPIDLSALNEPLPVRDDGTRQEDDADGVAGATRTNETITSAPAKLAQDEERVSKAMVLASRDARFELAPYEMQPHSIDDAWRLATMAIRARVLPQWGLTEQAAMVIMAGRERGIPAFTALQNGYVVKGKLGWSAMLLAAQVASAPECEYFEISATSAKAATVVSKRRGRPERALTYTLDEARQAGLVKSNIDRNGDESCQWLKRPATMLRWAALREAARAFWPERCVGMYTPAELRERFDDADAEVETAGEVA